MQEAEYLDPGTGRSDHTATAQPHSSPLRGVVNQYYLHPLIRLMQSREARACPIIRAESSAQTGVSFPSTFMCARYKKNLAHVNVLGPRGPNQPILVHNSFVRGIS